MNSNQWESVMSHKLKQDVSIGGNLKRLRLKAGYTQEEVGTHFPTHHVRPLITQIGAHV